MQYLWDVTLRTEKDPTHVKSRSLLVFDYSNTNNKEKRTRWPWNMFTLSGAHLHTLQRDSCFIQRMIPNDVGDHLYFCLQVKHLNN